jgi:hypothetical protein
MKLVDTLTEQDLLEEIIEESKPPVPHEARDLGYLLATPFRYVPFQPGSRFRSPSDPGVFYGAELMRTAAAEVGYWRWIFLLETEGLDRLGPASHTAFSVPISARAVDLRIPPFDRDTSDWTNPHEFEATRVFARIAREAGIEVIFYLSVRATEQSWCAALLTARAFTSKRPDKETQSWHLLVTRDEAIWRRESGGSFSFPTSHWR